MRVRGIILVGGGSKGTRFRPLSFDLPKPLVPLAGKPMITHHLEGLARVPNLLDVLLLGFYDESLFAEFIESASARLQVAVRYVREGAALGTAGGMLRYREAVEAGSPDVLFILHCDIASSFPLCEMLAFHQRHGRPLTVLGKRIMGDTRAYGCIVKDERTDELLHYAEKPETAVSALINCGVYVASTRGFYALLEAAGQERARGLAAHRLWVASAEGERGRVQIEQDIIMTYEGRQQIYVYECDDFWCQVKSPEAALRASAMYLQHYASTQPELLAQHSHGMEARAVRNMRADGLNYGRDSVNVSHAAPTFVGNVYVHPTARVAATAKLGPNVSVAAGCVVGDGARLVNCMALEDSRIEEHALVRNAVVGWGSTVGEWARVEGDDLTAEAGGRISILGANVECAGEIVVRNCTVLPHKALTVSALNQIIL